MKVYEGHILTCDAQDHVYQYLVEENGKIAYVGDTLPAKYDGHLPNNPKLSNFLLRNSEKDRAH